MIAARLKLRVSGGVTISGRETCIPRAIDAE